ncbi:hypothetical protein BRPE64_CCDS00480 [Caballeronia insecticola]|uniref:Uncharacterized protein n=1 Tax=Caballeronia insecticola TaxID=758793 RepID=R4X1H0_9BURK|nr:hypothetical protein BRPE64_CCDS00480 [Caballeronia insecticola]
MYAISVPTPESAGSALFLSTSCTEAKRNGDRPAHARTKRVPVSLRRLSQLERALKPRRIRRAARRASARSKFAAYRE